MPTTSTSYYETSLIDFDSVSQSQSQFQTNDHSLLNTSTTHMQSSTTFDNLVSLPPKSMADLLNKSNDFEVNVSASNRTPNLAYWFGISKFLLIAPTRSNVFIDNESRARVILMSASVAINNTGWYVFVLRFLFSLCKNSEFEKKSLSSLKIVSNCFLKEMKYFFLRMNAFANSIEPPNTTISTEFESLWFAKI